VTHFSVTFQGLLNLLAQMWAIDYSYNSSHFCTMNFPSQVEYTDDAMKYLFRSPLRPLEQNLPTKSLYLLIVIFVSTHHYNHKQLALLYAVLTLSSVCFPPS